MRRLRFGLNTVALERDAVPPEGPFDVALTNGLAAIVASDHAGSEKDRKGRILAARQLLDILEAAGSDLDFGALREGLDVTQPLRHGGADDEFLMPVRRHLQALVALDEHPALRVLEDARSVASTDELLSRLYDEAVREAAGVDYLSLKEQLDRPDFEICDVCGRETFLPEGFDDFGGTLAPGQCFACGYRRDDETARDQALAAEWERVKDKF